MDGSLVIAAEPDGLTDDQIYNALDGDHSMWVQEGLDNDRETLVLEEDFQNGLKQLHAYVEKVQNFQGPAFRFVISDNGVVHALRTPLSVIPPPFLVSHWFHEHYEVSEHVKAFLHVFRDLGLDLEWPFQNALAACLAFPGKTKGWLANQFIDALRQRVRTAEFRGALAHRRFKSQENFRRGTRLIDALFARYSRLNVVRLDFSYMQGHQPTLPQIKADFGRLLNNHRQNAVFNTVLGYIWHLEWAARTGYHVHVIFFLDGSKTLRDGYAAQLIAEYWQSQITSGRGRAHNCNLDKRRYRRLGIGMISHDDLDKRDVLVNVVLRYLTKADELVQPRIQATTKRFATSQIPAPHPGTGRKRRSARTVC